MSGRGAPKQQSGGRGGGGRGGSSGKRESILELAKVRLLTFYGASLGAHALFLAVGYVVTSVKIEAVPVSLQFKHLHGCIYFSSYSI